VPAHDEIFVDRLSDRAEEPNPENDQESGIEREECEVDGSRA